MVIAIDIHESRLSALPYLSQRRREHLAQDLHRLEVCVTFSQNRDRLALFEANIVTAKTPEKLALEGDHCLKSINLVDRGRWCSLTKCLARSHHICA
jgi:hypothetical protein